MAPAQWNRPPEDVTQSVPGKPSVLRNGLPEGSESAIPGKKHEKNTNSWKQLVLSAALCVCAPSAHSKARPLWGASAIDPGPDLESAEIHQRQNTDAVDKNMGLFGVILSQWLCDWGNLGEKRGSGICVSRHTLSVQIFNFSDVRICAHFWIYN